jgi:hypothetical protein
MNIDNVAPTVALSTVEPYAFLKLCRIDKIDIYK